LTFPLAGDIEGEYDMARETMKALLMFKTTGGRIGSKLVRRKAWREASSPDLSTATGCPRRS
jgi:hypothetical protein